MKKLAQVILFITLLLFIVACSTPRSIYLNIHDDLGERIEHIAIQNMGAKKFTVYGCRRLDDGNVLEVLIPKKDTVFLKLYRLKSKYPTGYKNIYKEKHLNISNSDTVLTITMERIEEFIQHQDKVDELINNAKVIKGIVIDENDGPIVGVMIEIMNLPLFFYDERVMAISDIEGEFEFKLPQASNRIKTHFLGYETKEVDIHRNDEYITIKLKSYPQQLSTSY